MKLKLFGLLLLFCMLLGMCESGFAATGNSYDTNSTTQSSLVADCFSGAAEGLLPILPEVVANTFSNCSLPYPYNKDLSLHSLKSYTQVTAPLSNYHSALQPCKAKQSLPIYILVRLLLI
ncbi:MAG: hypothetical protein KA149_08465 [Chitinophagales bacterium]|nr:hypothetical protein [Chitinophagales bacterium]